MLDTSYTFIQHTGKVLDGDLIPIVTYAEQYQALKGQPFGWKAISEGERYGGVNRYFVHWYLATYFDTVPFFLQRFVSPIDSLYLASGLAKTLMHLLLIGFLARIIVGREKCWRADFWYVMLIVLPLFQSGGHFYKYFAFVDQSITYSSFYALPMVLFLAYFKPYHDALIHQRTTFGLRVKLGLALLIILLPFSGPLIPGIVLVIALLAMANIAKDYLSGQTIYLYDHLPTFMRISFGVLVVLSIYSIFLGSYNAESGEATITLLERYQRLPVGLYYLFTQKLAYPILFLMLGINLFLIKKQGTHAGLCSKIVRWTSLFILLYLLLLPLGGFRDYRPNIIRKDTFLPVAVCFLYLYGYSTFLLLRDQAFHYWKLSLITVLSFSLVFIYADEVDLDLYQCQREALAEMAEASSAPVLLTDDCTILTWYPVTDPTASKRITQQLEYWNILKEEKMFYQVIE